MNRITNNDKYKNSKLVRITEGVYNILRKQKKEQKKSMSQIIEDLIINKYKNGN